MNPKVLSQYTALQHTFSDEEMRELALYIEKQLGKTTKVRAKSKKQIEAEKAQMCALQFLEKHRRKHSA